MHDIIRNPEAVIFQQSMTCQAMGLDIFNQANDGDPVAVDVTIAFGPEQMAEIVAIYYFTFYELEELGLETNILNTEDTITTMGIMLRLSTMKLMPSKLFRSSLKVVFV